MTLLITINKKHMHNVAFINAICKAVISEVLISIVVVSKNLQKSVSLEKKNREFSTKLDKVSVIKLS
jgi:hypothetical protein